MKNINSMLFSVLFLLFMATGCTGLNTVGKTASAGDTVVIALGWQQELTRQDVEVTVTDSLGSLTVYPPGDAAVRALFQSYPDPVSNLFVGDGTGQGAIDGSSAALATTLIDAAATGGDKDYSQSFMVLDLPASMALGAAAIAFADPGTGNPISKPTVAGGVVNPVNIQIVATGGVPDEFTTQDDIMIIDGYLKAMERSTHNTISLQGSQIPYGVQLDFVHDPDLDNGGNGRAYVANPRGDLKNVTWSDDGFKLRVVLLPTRGQLLADIQQFKFYVAGGITGLALDVNGLKAYDINGNPIAAGIISVAIN